MEDSMPDLSSIFSVTPKARHRLLNQNNHQEEDYYKILPNLESLHQDVGLVIPQIANQPIIFQSGQSLSCYPQTNPFLPQLVEQQYSRSVKTDNPLKALLAANRRTFAPSPGSLHLVSTASPPSQPEVIERFSKPWHRPGVYIPDQTETSGTSQGAGALEVTLPVPDDRRNAEGSECAQKDVDSETETTAFVEEPPFYKPIHKRKCRRFPRRKSQVQVPAVPETPERDPKEFAASLGLVAVAASRKPTVWLNVTLQVDTTAEMKRGQPCAQYRSLITNILTEIYFPPCLSAPDDLLPDDMSATATYDDRGRLTVLQVEYIGPGIYRVESDGGGSPGRSCTRAVSLSRVDSLETLEPSSQYFILGDLCPVPKTFQKCHRNAQIRYKKLQEYLYSREFRTYTLPLLLQTGEDDVWTEGLKAPRTRSRAAENEDESFSRTIAKRKATATTNEEQPNVILTRSRKRARNSAQNTPLREESSSTSDVSSLSSPSEESAPSLPSLSEPTSPVTFNTESGCQLPQPTPTPPPTCPVSQAPKQSPQISISPVVNDFATPVLSSPHNNPDAIVFRSSTASQIVSNNTLAPRSVSPTSAVLPRSAVPAGRSTIAPEHPAFTARVPPYHPIHAERQAFFVGGSNTSPGQPVTTARMPLIHTVQKSFSNRASIVTLGQSAFPTMESFTFPDQPAFRSRMFPGPPGETYKEQSCLPLARTFPTPSACTTPSPDHNTPPRRSPYLVSPAPSASPVPSLTSPDPLDLPELSFGDELSICLPLDLTVRPDFDTLPLDLSVSHRTR